MIVFLGYQGLIDSTIVEDFADKKLLSIPTLNISDGVETLILSRNLISQIGDNAFAANTNLTILKLDANKLTYISPSAFSGCPLEILDLGENGLTEFPSLASVGSTLKSLDLTQNHISGVTAAAFEPLVVLTEVKLNNNFELNNLDFRHGFQPALTDVHLLWTKLHDLNENFTNMPYVSRLSVSDGSFLMDTVTDADFAISSLRRLALELMQLTVFPHFPQTANNLLYISLRGNNFSAPITADALAQFSQLQYLMLSRCHISVFPNIYPLRETLLSLDLEFNDISHIPPQSFDNFTQLRTFYFSDNPVGAIPDFGSLSPSIQHLQLSNIGMLSIDCSRIKVLTNIQYLTIRANGFNTTCIKSLAGSLKQLKMEWNAITQANYSYVSKLTVLSVLKLGNNPIKCIQQVCSN